MTLRENGTTVRYEFDDDGIVASTHLPIAFSDNDTQRDLAIAVRDAINAAPLTFDVGARSRTASINLGPDPGLDDRTRNQQPGRAGATGPADAAGDGDSDRSGRRDRSAADFRADAAGDRCQRPGRPDDVDRRSGAFGYHRRGERDRHGESIHPGDPRHRRESAADESGRVTLRDRCWSSICRLRWTLATRRIPPIRRCWAATELATLSFPISVWGRPIGAELDALPTDPNDDGVTFLNEFAPGGRTPIQIVASTEGFHRRLGRRGWRWSL